MPSARKRLCLSALLPLCLSTLPVLAQAPRPNITTPKQSIGFNMGDDYMLANYAQITAYLQKLAGESDRMKLVDIGPTAEGRRQYMVVVSSPENLAKLDHYKEIAARLAHAEDLTGDQAHALAEEGRAVVWIDGGLHASETVGFTQLIETIYELNAFTDPETLRFLHDDIALLVFANPDGDDLVANWYMRQPDPTKRIAEGPSGNTPRLWAKYIGHDNNRDFYMNNMPESTNMSRVLFREWFPQLMYNHHQAGPAGTIIFMPPFRDPFNYHFDPLIPLKIEAVGTAMHERLVEEDKGGSVMRSNAPYSTWYNGGLRTVTYFHNITGILTEIIGSPTPAPVPFIAARQLPGGDQPLPIAPQLWHYAQSIAYEQTNNRAMLDYASRNRTTLLYDTYIMAKRSITAGNQDSWTVTPKRIEALEAAAATARPTAGASSAGRGARGSAAASAGTGPSGTIDTAPAPAAPTPAPTAAPDAPNPFARPTGLPAALYTSILHDPAHRDPRGYILSADQPDFPTAVKFVNTLMKSGVTIQRATSAFDVEGKHYPAGSLVILCNQAYRPMILDMLEPQDHPNDFAYPGAAPTRPYDATGWTLAYQMGVTFDREYSALTGPFEKITTDLAAPPAGTIAGPAKPAGYLVSHEYNDAYTLTNRLLKAHLPVYWLKQPTAAAGKTLAPGALYIPYSAAAHDLLETAAKTLGINATAIAAKPTGEALLLHPTRIGLFDQYGGLMPSGWVRWLFEQFEFPFTLVYPQTLDAGNLNATFDDLVFTDGVTMPSVNPTPEGPGNRGGAQPKPEEIPAEFRPWLGRITADKTLPQLQKFVESGGTLLAIGSSSRLYATMHLPLHDALTEVVKGKEQPVPSERFYIPGSLIRAQVDPSEPVGYGVPAAVDVFFDNSPAFRATPSAPGLHTVAYYGEGNLLDSGWAWGQPYLNNSIAVAQATLGRGKVILYGPEITFRGQPHATFKFLFNGLLYGPATPETLH